MKSQTAVCFRPHGRTRANSAKSKAASGKIVLSDKTTSVEAAGEAYTLTVRMPGDNGNRLIVSTAGDLTLTQKEEALLRGDAEYTCTLKNGNGDIVAEQTYPAGAEAHISLERGTLSDNG